MAALRSHPFFASIVWEKLWSDPAPPLEPGLLRREDLGLERKWEDVGAAWDALVEGKEGKSSSALDSDDEEDEDDDEGSGTEEGKEGKRVRIAGEDGIEWARDGEGTEFGLFGGGRRGDNNGTSVHATPPTPLGDLGPLNELPDYAGTLGVAGVSGLGQVVTDDRMSERTMLAPKIHRSRVNGNGALQFQLAEPQRDSLVRDDEDEPGIVSVPAEEGDAAETATEAGAHSDTSSETSESVVPPGVGMLLGTGMGMGILEGDEPPEGKTLSGAVEGVGAGAADVDADSGVGLGMADEGEETSAGVVMKSEPIAVPGHVRNSRSLTGSSDGSPVEKLGAAWGATFNRGRLRTRAPIVEVTPIEPDW